MEQVVIPVIVVHASPVIRGGLGEILRRYEDIRLIGAFGSVQEALEHAAEEPHILLYDFWTMRQDGTTAVQEFREHCRSVKIIVFDVAYDDETIVACVRVGASGCILQDAHEDELLDAVRSVWRGTPAGRRITPRRSIGSWGWRTSDEPAASHAPTTS